jgi:hypothetical protein
LVPTISSSFFPATEPAEPPEPEPPPEPLEPLEPLELLDAPPPAELELPLLQALAATRTNMATPLTTVAVLRDMQTS